MRTILGFLVALLLFPASSFALDPDDIAEARDYPRFSRMPGFYIGAYAEQDFEAFDFPLGDDKVQTVEGHYWRYEFYLKEGAKEPGSLAIIRNHEAIAKKSGGGALYTPAGQASDYRSVTFRYSQGGTDVWLFVEAWPAQYILTIVEVAAMAQVISANEMKASLDAQGYVALYLTFATGKETLDPASAPIIDQVVALMKENPVLALSVEGHTDNVGAPKANLALSQARAKSVVAALTAKGVAASRLTSAGFGQDRPVADNRSEEGRAKNRRVELVKKK
ncbi:MAG: OmpA family protein [Nitrospinae bacterium]|nr:OmpA family protein [Nitrospinota bacterium]